MGKKLLVLAMMVACSVALLAQMNAPSFMVLPSDSYCIRNGYAYEVQTDDGPMKVADYYRCITEDKEMMMAINFTSGVLAKRNAVVKDLMNAAKTFYKEAESGAQPARDLYSKIVEKDSIDIAVTLDFDVKQQQFGRVVSVFLTGIAIDTGDFIANTISNGFPTIGTNLSEDIQQGILEHIDLFIDDINNYFMSKIAKSLEQSNLQEDYQVQ